MLKTIIRSLYYAFISIVLISIVLASWTSYAFLSQSSKSNEITHLIKDIYENQKSIVIDIVDLSKILIKDTSKPIATENNNLQVENKSQADLEDNSQLDESLSTGDNGDNPLGIVIEPSELIQDPLFIEKKDVSMNGMNMD